ncbi:MAG TPA: dTDP-4-dehydrorhamnose 3,5-epimerase [Patescibacteria group bacterium]|nr:dTDP-4-dehydrorhamnose 3,5-epimerase [Patescibacteria group bacterium]
MNVHPLEIADVLLFEPTVFEDERGFFIETYNQTRYRAAGIPDHFVQDNLSFSKKGVLRGLHYQAPPHALGKLVSVLRGRVFDVAVDIRSGSLTFGKHVAVELSQANKKQLWIPPGFAHGFLALEDDTLFSYKCTNAYEPSCDRGIAWNDPDLAIQWPIANPIVSEKDQKHPLLSDIPHEKTAW